MTKGNERLRAAACNPMHSEVWVEAARTEELAINHDWWPADESRFLRSSETLREKERWVVICLESTCGAALTL